MENLKNRYQATQEEVNRLKEEDQSFVYATLTKYIPKIAHIHEMDFEQVLKAKRFLNDLNSAPYQKEMEELGITEKEAKSENSDRFLGVRISVWENDLETRVEELRHNKRYANLLADLPILHRNLDKDDVRSIDLEQLSEETL